MSSVEVEMIFTSCILPNKLCGLNVELLKLRTGGRYSNYVFQRLNKMSVWMDRDSIVSLRCSHVDAVVWSDYNSGFHEHISKTRSLV
jgi:hypothetical protein